MVSCATGVGVCHMNVAASVCVDAVPEPDGNAPLASRAYATQCGYAAVKLVCQLILPGHRTVKVSPRRRRAHVRPRLFISFTANLLPRTMGQPTAHMSTVGVYAHMQALHYCAHSHYTRSVACGNNSYDNHGGDDGNHHYDYGCAARAQPTFMMRITTMTIAT